jgi:hypothetical protein
MSSYEITIFIAPPEAAKVVGRYICLLRGKTDEENRYFAEDSIVELAKSLGEKETDWPFVENALTEKGIYER